MVPMYNERERVGSVLSGLLEVKEISRVVCVDDGSSDGSGEMVKRQFPKVRLVKLKKNSGKMEAVRAGVRIVGDGDVLLFDADYFGFDPREVGRGIRLFTKNRLGMLVFRQRDNAWIHHVVKTDLVIAGQRIVNRQLLERALKMRKAKGYQLELVINAVVEEAGVGVSWVWLGGDQRLKMEKRGWKLGVVEGLKMIRDTIGYRGLGWYVGQFVQNDWKEVG